MADSRQADPWAPPGTAHARVDGHLRPLDGLRGVAVLAVLAFHSGASWATGGSVGVDVFFVLSGFLITLLLIREHDATGRLALLRFYARRVLRLMPALLLVVAAVVAYRALAPHPVATSMLRSGVIGSLLYVSDLQAATGHVPVLGLIEHTWSLSIEEHFYLLWPALLALLLRGSRPGPRGRRVPLLLGVTAALALISALLVPLLWSGPGSVARLYYAPDTRAQQLLIGCLLGIVAGSGRLTRTPRAERAAAVAGPLALAGLLVWAAAGSYRSPGYYAGGMTALGVAAAVLIAALVVLPDGPVGRLLAAAPLVGVGRISYGLYLWHWPVFLVLNSSALGLGWLPTQAIRVAVSVAVASASYFLVERRCLRLRLRFEPDRRAPASVLRPV